MTVSSAYPPARRWRGYHELALLIGLYGIYSVSRLLPSGTLAHAQVSAGHVLHLESILGINVESWTSATVAGVAWLAVPASYWYATLHYLVTPAALYYVYRRHHDDYGRVRIGLVVGSALGLVGFVLAPTAPPRLMPHGFTDVLAQYSSFGWWSGSASVPDGLGGLSNQLAAMPSLHVGWALWVAWALWHHVGRVGRLLGAGYVVGTFLVVVGTGNHWVLDGVAGIAVMSIGFVVANAQARRRSAAGRAISGMSTSVGGRSGSGPEAAPALIPSSTTAR